jgi:OmpA-OmpF porin, OOP family
MKFTPASASLSLLALAALAALTSPMAIAQDGGWYGGANIGRSLATIDDQRITSGLLSGGLATSSIADRDRSHGFKIFGGYQINPNFSVEGGYFDLGKFGYTATTVPAGTLNGDIKVKGLNLDLVGTVPVTDKFSAFGRAGLNYAQAKDSFTSTGAVRVTNANPSKNATNYKFGLGVQYAINDALAVRGEAERYRVNDAVGNKGHIDVLSVGLIYRFGAKAQAPTRQAVAPALAPVPEIVAAAPPPPPPPPPPAQRFEKYTLSATELFAFNSAELKPQQPKLDEIATALKGDGAVNNVVITGYADRIGSQKANQTLSEHRAASVKTYLTSQGVEANRLKAEGKGEANPVLECRDKKRPALIACLAPNRRVEVEQITIERRVL